MREYNLSEIMKRAWELRKGTCGYTKPYKTSFSECLKIAWAQAKNGCFGQKKEVKKSQNLNITINAVARWFVQKNFSQNEAYAIELSDMVAIKETAKAFFIEASSNFGKIKFWAPKSVCEF